MRLCYLNVVTESENYLSAFADVLHKNWALSKRPDTDVELRTVTKSMPDLKYFLHNYFIFLYERELMEEIVQAEKDGFDGVMIGCFFDPCLWQGREAVDIPVVGPGESSMLMACMMGYRFATICIHADVKPCIDAILDRYRLWGRAISHNPVRPLYISTEDQTEALLVPQKQLDDFEKVSKSCVADGAEVIIPACAVMSPIIQMGGLREVDGAIVLDIQTAQLKFLETLVDLKKAGLNFISRKNVFKKPSEEDMREFRAHMEYLGAGSYDFTHWHKEKKVPA